MVLCGVLGAGLIAAGTVLIWGQYLDTYVLSQIRDKISLVESTELYRVWSNPIELTFECYLFNVTNPDEVMQGSEPNINEVGPLTFDETLEKKVIDIDEENDEISYLMKQTFTFNRHKSVNLSSHDKITILNPAYVGAISALTALPEQFMKSYGNIVPKLFPNRTSIFLKARPTDILFNGVKITCNEAKFPELKLICKTLKANPPPVLRETEKEGVYFLSFFQRVNATYRGPFTINRGSRNVSLLGDTSAYMGKRMQTFWQSDKCNKVKGTDTITWPPLVTRVPFVATFIPEMCRTVEADYTVDVSIHGITGSLFSLQERSWFLNESKCYCPIVDKKVECLPRGLGDVSACQQAPIIVSEPHFLHGDPSLLSYAHGLKPNEKLHSTYIVIEPITGVPLSGNKKLQLNMKLSKQPVELLSNVSEGFFPILWCGDGNVPTLAMIKPTYQTLRLLHLLSFIQLLPVALGIYMLILSLFLRASVKDKVEPSVCVPRPISVMAFSQVCVDREAPRHPLHNFQRFQRVHTTF